MAETFAESCSWLKLQHRFDAACKESVSCHAHSWRQDTTFSSLHTNNRTDVSSYKKQLKLSTDVAPLMAVISSIVFQKLFVTEIFS